MWKRILVPHDFSECASQALVVACELAAATRGSLTLVHVSPLPPNLPPSSLITPEGAAAPIRIDEYVTRGVGERLAAIAAPLRERGLDPKVVALATTSSDVVSEILRVASESRADVIVAGTHGRTGLSHLLLGSVTEHLVRRACVPVVTVRVLAPEAAATPEEGRAEDEVAG